ncbi:hypothetical protein SMNI109538_14775 [Smaragdicoccus niigatensis]
MTGKRRYRDGELAKHALRNVRMMRQLAEELGVETRRRECRSYRCDGCNGFHLTSWA